MKQEDSPTTHLHEYIALVLPWAHGHQLKSITTFVKQILDKQTGVQAELARGLGNQEAATKRLSRLLHNPRLAPKALAEAVLNQALCQLPQRGKVRLSVDWTSEDEQHLLVISLAVGRRAVPTYWRAYDQSVLKGRMQRYELAVVRRAIERVKRVIHVSRLVITVDRGFADVKLFELLDHLGVEFVIRVKGNIKVFWQGEWRKLGSLGWRGNTRRHSLGRLSYCEGSPQQLWVTMSRARNATGWGIWYLVSNRHHTAQAATTEYGHRFSCEEGFRDAKWWLGFKEARIQSIQAWSRFFALIALALLVAVSVGSNLLLKSGAAARDQALDLLRRVACRRRQRWELSLVNAVVSLLRHDKSLWK